MGFHGDTLHHREFERNHARVHPLRRINWASRDSGNVVVAVRVFLGFSARYDCSLCLNRTATEDDMTRTGFYVVEGRGGWMVAVVTRGVHNSPKLHMSTKNPRNLIGR
jgi:hypothetical protein